MTRSCLDFDPFCEVCDRTVGPIQLTFDARTSDLTDAEHAELEATALALHTAVAHGDACPHGFPSRASCIACMASGAVSAPLVDASGSAERADSHPFNGRYDKDCPVCHFTMLDAPVVHTTRNRYAHVACVDKREADRG